MNSQKKVQHQFQLNQTIMKNMKKCQTKNTKLYLKVYHDNTKEKSSKQVISHRNVSTPVGIFSTPKTYASIRTMKDDVSC
jgi:hypothetical protein